MRYTEFDQMRALRWVKKIKSINFLGGKCEKCGEKDFLVLEFHHSNPDSKKYNIARILSHTVKNVQIEASKCVVLCRNCHSEKHYSSKKATYKDNMLEYKNVSCCQKCGYKKSIHALDFHHIDEHLKAFGLGNKSYGPNSKEYIKTMVEKEIDKCIVLCKNCHAIEHVKNKFEKIKELVDIKLIDHVPNSSPMSKKRISEMNIKNSNYRSKLAQIIIAWRRCGKNLFKTSKELNMDANTISDNIAMSEIYRKYRQRVSQKTSRYKGVSWVKSRKKWLASLKHNGKTINLGRFNLEVEAHRTISVFLRENGII